MNKQSIPLCIDLDGTLLDSDMLIEVGFAFLKAKPHKAGSVFFWLKDGKATLKAKLADDAEVDVSVLPYNRSVLGLIENAKAEGRQVHLATATHRILAERIAEYLGCFDEVISTDDETNLSAHQKQMALVERFGEAGYDYVGNSQDDLVVWQLARSAIVVNPERGVETRAMQLASVTGVVEIRPDQRKTWIKALRLHCNPPIQTLLEAA